MYINLIYNQLNLSKMKTNQRKAVMLSLLAMALIAAIWGFGNFTPSFANDQTEIKLRTASRVSNASLFAIQDAKANLSPEMAESVNCGEPGAECRVLYQGSVIATVKDKREVEIVTN